MTVVADGIDLGGSDVERYRHLRRIIENVLADTDPYMSEDRRKWLLWLFLYICWWEGSRATTRTQTGGGPGRGFMQFEPQTVADLIQQYILARPALVANLAAAAGVTEREMREALEAFLRSAATSIVWPNPSNPGPEKRIDEWLSSLDSFGVKLMRYEFKRHGQHRFPPADPSNEGKNPQDERFKSEFSEQWARWWKKSFGGGASGSPEEERARQRRNFEERARALDGTAAAGPSDGTPSEPPPTVPPEPTPTPTPPAPSPNPVQPTPPTPPGGTCPFVIAFGPESIEVARLRELRADLSRSAAGRGMIRAYYGVLRPWLTLSLGAPAALLAWRFGARQLATASQALTLGDGRE